jgi:hypothetical protein
MHITRSTIGFLLALALAACSGPRAARPGVVYPAACTLLPAQAAVDTLTVALHGEDVSSLLFRQLYETLVTVDCLGGVHAGLAVAWHAADEGRRWSFELRPEARFWDGSPVTASAVVAGWQDALARHAAVDSAVASGDQTVQVYFGQARSAVPRLLAASDFAVTAPSVPTARPLGSGPYRPAAPGSDDVFVAAPGASARPVLEIVEPAEPDPRDWLDGRAGLVLTSDPGMLEYASRRPRNAVLPLPWDTTYVLLSATRIQDLASGRLVGRIPTSLGDAVVRDAVRSDARAYRPPSWWHEADGCSDPGSGSATAAPPTPAYALSQLRRILYDENDPVARDLAERLAALAAMDPDAFPEAGLIAEAVPGMAGGPAPLRAMGVPRPTLDEHLGQGDAFAFVVPVPARPPDPCAAAGTLFRRVPWLASPGASLAQALIPLVDTRPHVVAATGGTGLVVDWYGNLLLTAGPSAR